MNIFLYQQTGRVAQKNFPCSGMLSLQDNTIMHIYPNSHRALYDRNSNSYFHEPKIIKLRKGQLFIFNALLAHHGHGYGKCANTRLHFYFVYKEQKIKTSHLEVLCRTRKGLPNKWGNPVTYPLDMSQRNRSFECPIQVDVESSKRLKALRAAIALRKKRKSNNCQQLEDFRERKKTRN